jgi:hypothetical protein
MASDHVTSDHDPVTSDHDHVTSDVTLMHNTVLEGSLVTVFLWQVMTSYSFYVFGSTDPFTAVPVWA